MTQTSTIVGSVAVLIAAASVPTVAQMGGDPAPHRAAMAQLDFLVGQWEGDGWRATREGRQEIRQAEDVRYELGGTILVIEGTARERTGAQFGEVIFNAYAVVSWSAESGYQMRSYLWNGLLGDREIEVRDGGFTWGQRTEGGPVTYTMEITPEGEWHEVGQLDRGGGQVFPIIEFRLRRM